MYISRDIIVHFLRPYGLRTDLDTSFLLEEREKQSRTSVAEAHSHLLLGMHSLSHELSHHHFHFQLHRNYIDIATLPHTVKTKKSPY